LKTHEKAVVSSPAHPELGPLALVQNRMARQFNFDTEGAYHLTGIDPATGRDRTYAYVKKGNDYVPTHAAPGTEDFFRTIGAQFVYSALENDAIAPLWEAQTARLQTLMGDASAGLTEYQRAERKGLLAVASARRRGCYGRRLVSRNGGRFSGRTRMACLSEGTRLSACEPGTGVAA